MESNAYQLSSRYDETWQDTYVPLFNRHFARRLDAEEIHDAIAKTSGVIPSYSVNFWAAPMNWAMQFPDTSEPTGNGAVRTFLDTFARGNRETQRRLQSSSPLQELSMMNDAFVVSRIKMAASPALKEIAKITATPALVEEMFLTFLSRMPSDAEAAAAVTYISKGTTATLRNTYIEDLAWSLINKTDFILSY